MKHDGPESANLGIPPEFEHLNAAVNHVHDLITSGNVAVTTVKGLLYGLVEVLGTVVGDPDLPEQAKAGYEGLLELAREMLWKITSK